MGFEENEADAKFENSVEDLVKRYKKELEPLIPYIPWLKQNAGSSLEQEHQESSATMAFPVYDATLLQFVKAAAATDMMNRNYVYMYTRNRLKTAKDELNFIDNAQIKDLDDLADILSKYVLEGMTKGRVWAEGIQNSVFYSVLTKMQEIVKKWDQGDN